MQTISRTSQAASRVVLRELPRLPQRPANSVERGSWAAGWISIPRGKQASFVAAYRLPFRLEAAASFRVHVSGDQRYELFLDGERCGRGPERGSPMKWCFESYDFALPPGEHVLVARVWTLDLANGIAPAAQLEVGHGFWLAAEEPFAGLLSTGLALWEGKLLGGYHFLPPVLEEATLAGGSVAIDGNYFPWGCEAGAGKDWAKVETTHAGRTRLDIFGEFNWGALLEPARLPAMIEVRRPPGRVRHIDAAAISSSVPVRKAAHLSGEAAAWQELAENKGTVLIPPQTCRRVIFDLENYFCGYAEVTLSGGLGSRVRLHWAEALHETPSFSDQKGNRDHLEEKYFHGRGDSFVADGGNDRRYRGLWWMAGRYLEVLVETESEPLILGALSVDETRYPLEMEGRLETSDACFGRLMPVMWRTLQLCSHETYMDCPYYEQMMYAGDTRLQVLVTYALNRDDRLPRKAIELFAASLAPNGLTQSRYPSNRPQTIPQFSIFWIAMLHDFALWRGDLAFVRAQMPVARMVIETFLRHVRYDDLLVLPEGWDWVDWAEGWPFGQPPRGRNGTSGINHWQFVMVLAQAIELEKWLGEPLLARRLTSIRDRLAEAGIAAFWHKKRGLFSDTVEGDFFSEHAQCYAVLSGVLSAEKESRIRANLVSGSGLTRGTYYFQHYLFETWRKLNCAGRILERMVQWEGMLDLGAKTVFEKPDPTRSDCHAWGSHPLFHGVATLAGIRPAGPGFKEVVVAPQFGGLDFILAGVPHPGGGKITAEFRRRDDEDYEASIELPDGVSGVIQIANRSQPLSSGVNHLRIKSTC